MSLAVVLLTAGLTSIAASPPLDNRHAARNCSSEELVAAGFAPADLKRLDELPPAYHHLAVIRSVGGCFVATIKVEGRVYWSPLPRSLGGRLQPLEKGPAVRRRVERGFAVPR
jgi:hypothetical protein